MTNLHLTSLPVLTLVALVALLLSFWLNALFRPWLARHALARPNARSSHRQPTPQGGGLAVVLATLSIAWLFIALAPALLKDQGGVFITLTAATVLLAIVGAVDDIRTVAAAPRLALQCIAAAGVIAMLPSDTQIAPIMPLWLERTGMFLGLVWFINLVNFMDGVDWMTVAEAVPITGAIVFMRIIGAVEFLPALIAAALLGGILGFAPFNKPVAKLFLGDVGSLPIGLLLGWLLLELAAKGHWAAALLLPLYYLADATLTLARRAVAGEPVWQAHRTHFYQRAIDGGFTVIDVVSRVFVINLGLVALALTTIVVRRIDVSLMALGVGAGAVAILLAVFARGKR